MSAIKTITLRMDDELHKKLKIKTVLEDTTIQEYLTTLIQRELGTIEEKEK